MTRATCPQWCSKFESLRDRHDGQLRLGPNSGDHDSVMCCGAPLEAGDGREWLFGEDLQRPSKWSAGFERGPDWKFTPKTTGGTVITWTYSFRPLRGRKTAVRLLIVPLRRIYMRRALARTVAEVERQAAV